MPARLDFLHLGQLFVSVFCFWIGMVIESLSGLVYIFWMPNWYLTHKNTNLYSGHIYFFKLKKTNPGLFIRKKQSCFIRRSDTYSGLVQKLWKLLYVSKSFRVAEVDTLTQSQKHCIKKKLWGCFIITWMTSDDQIL